MSDETYNGWKGNGNRASAYATWRVNLEVFDVFDVQESFDVKPDGRELADWLREYVDEYIHGVLGEYEDETAIIAGWIGAFLDDVNWDEIADTMLSDWEEEEEDA